MKALVFNMNLAKAALLKGLGAMNPAGFYDGPLAVLKLKEVDEPNLPSSEWVKIKTAACGFCGSDLNLIFLRESVTASPFGSFPCILGHEFSGTVVEAGAAVDNVEEGDRVTVMPVLSCETRNIRPVCAACEKGLPASCENFAEGSLAPGMFTGICQDVGGGFAPYVVAHKSQLYKLPKGLDDETGAMVEPLSVALNAVLENPPQRQDRVLVIGGGVIGCLVLRAIRALDSGCGVTVAEPSPHAAEYCKNSGADHLITDGDIIGASPTLTLAKSYKPIMGKNILMGGYDRIFDTVGSAETLNASLRCLTAGGALSVLGIGEAVKLDMTPLWLKNQKMLGHLAYGMHEYKKQTRHVYEIALDLLNRGEVQVKDLVTHRFGIQDFKAMIEVNRAKSAHGAMKTMVKFPQ